jgi:hypothetical protein
VTTCAKASRRCRCCLRWARSPRRRKCADPPRHRARARSSGWTTS